MMLAIDFFCGAGGATLGLKDAGVSVIAAIDADDRCQGTYEYNNPEVRLLTSDARSNLAKAFIASVCDGVPRESLLFFASPPCQPFSFQNQKRSEGHKDIDLLQVFGGFVLNHLPGHVVVENVPGLASSPGILTNFLSLLQAAGYIFSYGVHCASDYGVPQKRSRFILLASRFVGVKLPPPGHGAPATVRDAISDLPFITAGSGQRATNHICAKVAEINLTRLRATPFDGGDRRYWPEHLRLHCHAGRGPAYRGTYCRLFWDLPAPTITTHFTSIGCGRYAHPSQDRGLSIREGARLQSFPDNYIFTGRIGSMARQVGNAVPPLMLASLVKLVFGKQ